MSLPSLSRASIASMVIALALPGSACKTSGGAPNAPTPEVPSPCIASLSWITSPNPPTEIGGGVPVEQETNCQFQQFAYQWFLALVQPTAPGSQERVFETFRIYQPGQKNQCALTGVSGKEKVAQSLFVRTKKEDSEDFDPVLPEEIAQATGQALYDQRGNVVFYTVLYNPAECEATSAGFKPNTIEIKTSWRKLDPGDPNLSRYYVMKATINTGTSLMPVTLGLVGFHLVINTQKHPEFVWATFEHKDNAPDCTKPQQTPPAGWSFTSQACANCLETQTPEQCAQANPQCAFNQGVESQSLTGQPNEVCRAYRDGTDPASMTGGNNNDVNRANIDMLNEQLVGQSGLLTRLPASSPMAVWKNYFLVGSLWTNGGVGSKVTDAQRGSLELSNTTMETFFQQTGNNCFTCHTYDPAKPLKVSHIAGDLLPSTVSSGSQAPEAAR